MRCAPTAAREQAQIERDRARMQLLAMQARRMSGNADTPDRIELAAALALESTEIARKLNVPAEADAIEVSRAALMGLPLRILLQRSPVKVPPCGTARGSPCCQRWR